MKSPWVVLTVPRGKLGGIKRGETTCKNNTHISEPASCHPDGESREPRSYDREEHSRLTEQQVHRLLSKEQCP